MTLKSRARAARESQRTGWIQSRQSRPADLARFQHGAAHALQSILSSELGPDLRLKEYALKAVTGGTDALANANITFSDAEGTRFQGAAIHSDVILASVLAMVQGANRAVNFRRRLSEAAKNPTT